MRSKCPDQVHCLCSPGGMGGLFPRNEFLVSRRKRESVNKSQRKGDNGASKDGDNDNEDDQGEDDDYHDFEDDDDLSSQKQRRHGIRPKQGTVCT